MRNVPSVYKTIVVGTDGSPTAAEAVRAAGKLAELCGATVHVVTAYRPTSELFFHPEFAALPVGRARADRPGGRAQQVAQQAVGRVCAACRASRTRRPGAAADVAL